MTSLEHYVERKLKKGLIKIDLTNSKHQDYIWSLSSELISHCRDSQELLIVENSLIQKPDPPSIFLLLALKIAQSRLIIDQVDRPILISVVFAVYKEHNRILPPELHPHGEDFLRRKVDQMNKLCSGNPYVKWELIIVDDGCPEESGIIANQIVIKEHLDEYVRVLYLEDAIRQNISVVKSLKSTSESQKGGAILYGMWDAISKQNKEDQYVIYTDADLSTHLGQLGLLVNPLIQGDHLISIGSRRENNSVVVKQGMRNARGKLFIYLWKRLIKPLHDVTDTQCGFKAFKKDILFQILDNLVEKKFAFDIELLLKGKLVDANVITKVGIAWIDSEEASTTTDLQPYLPMLKAIVKMYKKYLPHEKEAEPFAEFINQLDESGFQKLVDNIPNDILKRDPSTYDKFNDLKIENLKERIV